MLRAPLIAKKTNEYILEKAGTLATVKERKLRYFGQVMRKMEPAWKNQIMLSTLPGKWRRQRRRTSWKKNLMTWTGLTTGQLRA